MLCTVIVLLGLAHAGAASLENAKASDSGKWCYAHLAGVAKWCWLTSNGKQQFARDGVAGDYYKCSEYNGYESSDYCEHTNGNEVLHANGKGSKSRSSNTKDISATAAPAAFDDSSCSGPPTTTTVKPTGKLCGQHRAATCAKCPVIDGYNWGSGGCNGECVWSGGGCIDGPPTTTLSYAQLPERLQRNYDYFTKGSPKKVQMGQCCTYLTQDEAQGILDALNAQRCAVHGPDYTPLEWDPALQCQAQKLENYYFYGHSARSSRTISSGENCWMGGGRYGYWPIAGAIWNWFAEYSKCKGVKGCYGYGAGHYTQNVWKGAQKVGCGVSYKAGKGTSMRCQFHGDVTSGNMGGAYNTNVPAFSNRKSDWTRCGVDVSKIPSKIGKYMSLDEIDDGEKGMFKTMANSSPALMLCVLVAMLFVVAGVLLVVRRRQNCTPAHEPSSDDEVLLTPRSGSLE